MQFRLSNSKPAREGGNSKVKAQDGFRRRLIHRRRRRRRRSVERGEQAKWAVYPCGARGMLVLVPCCGAENPTVEAIHEARQHERVGRNQRLLRCDQATHGPWHCAGRCSYSLIVAISPQRRTCAFGSSFLLPWWHHPVFRFFFFFFVVVGCFPSPSLFVLIS